MFRDMRRKKQALSLDDCIDLLKTQTRGVLSVIGDDGYPYGMPMNHLYDEESGKIWFHCGRGGHREDALMQNSKVSFCVYGGDTKADGDWAWNVKSVIVFGTVDMTDDRQTVIDISRKLCAKFTQDDAYIQQEIDQHAHRTVLLALTPEHISGKLVNES